MYLKSFSCYNVNKEFLQNVTCRFKVTRDVPTGLAHLSGDAIHINNVFVQLILYFRYTGGYRPYLLDYTVDGCRIIETIKTISKVNVALRRIIIGIHKIFPSLFHNCPFTVSFSLFFVSNNFFKQFFFLIKI